MVLRLRRLVALLEIASGLRGSVCWVCQDDGPGPARACPCLPGCPWGCAGLRRRAGPAWLFARFGKSIKRAAMQGQCPVLLSSYSVPGMRLHLSQLPSIFVILCSALMCNASVFQARRFFSQARYQVARVRCGRGRGRRCSLWRAAVGWNAAGSMRSVRFQAVGGWRCNHGIIGWFPMVTALSA